MKTTTKKRKTKRLFLKTIVLKKRIKKVAYRLKKRSFSKSLKRVGRFQKRIEKRSFNDRFQKPLTTLPSILEKVNLQCKNNDK